MQRHIALFDLDGVVFDTEPQYTEFWGQQFREFYPSQSGLELAIKGMTLDQIFDEYFSGMSGRQTLIKQRLDVFEQDMDYRYVPGFEAFISKLHAMNVNTAVVTSSNQIKMSNVYRVRPEFLSYFDKVLTSEDFEYSKPHPDCYMKAAQWFGAEADECVGFEDSFNGLKSLVAAKMKVVALATTNPVEAVVPYADKVIGNYLGIEPHDVFLG